MYYHADHITNDIIKRKGWLLWLIFLEIVKYHKKSDLKLSFLLNPDNVFFDSKGYQCVITTENSAENINPLDFNSKYPAERFKTAIETKLINDTFTSLKKKGLDLGMITLIGIGIVIVILIYMIMGTV